MEVNHDFIQVASQRRHCRILAQRRPSAMSAFLSLSGVKRKWRRHRELVENDPKRTLATVAISQNLVYLQTIAVGDRKIRKRGSIADANLLIDVVKMNLYCSLGDIQLICDILVG
jgi:hypothetical protein